MFFVRTAMETDIPAVCVLLDASWHETYDALLGAEKVNQMVAGWHSPKAVKDRLERKGGEFLVADNGTRIGGMAYAAPSQKRADVVNLHQLYIHPECQRQGIGRDLFAEIETCFPNARKLALEVVIGNDAALAFYQAHGMSEAGRTENCGACGSGIPAIIMEKDLPGV
ncbi:GNAT family N-acetyltransferase [Martelella lutilitoris]|uniref:GNAT family N-acetyltransferase n=1 Tax=Martelella lutilitoris TaxID=2583532 RepID=A0A5C4JQY0_9HYPH|nr:GNAT family N-acetyltransferase [Martelella lutilitoris]TNB47895.1 GNAT family N-acetyltransferase [Martelella lutilitoris]